MTCNILVLDLFWNVTYGQVDFSSTSLMVAQLPGHLRVAHVVECLQLKLNKGIWLSNSSWMVNRRNYSSSLYIHSSTNMVYYIFNFKAMTCLARTRP
jgi:hypothetical protein